MFATILGGRRRPFRPHGLRRRERRLKDTEGTRTLFRAGYVVAALVVVGPLLDLIATARPLRLDEVQWRYGVLGLLGNVSMTPIMGMAMGALIAGRCCDARVLRLISLASLLGAGLLGVAVAMFGFDLLQLRDILPQQSITNFRVGAAIATGKYALGMAVLIGLGLGGLRSARILAAEPRPKIDPDAPGRVLKGVPA